MQRVYSATGAGAAQAHEENSGQPRARGVEYAKLATNVRGTKNTFFKKRTGEVVENKGSAYITSRKRTGNEPENEAEKLLKILEAEKSEPERTGERTGPCC
jgi:hypothetical protein